MKFQQYLTEKKDEWMVINHKHEILHKIKRGGNKFLPTITPTDNSQPIIYKTEKGATNAMTSSKDEIATKSYLMGKWYNESGKLITT